MPQISKCRIVNFWYNDGTRFIADELYDFGNMNSTRAGNVLIDMENGIGKTVLLQLMLQPVVPKAKIAGRRIEDFFSKGTYHSYVLLEWFKDNSSEKLLTGISMAASDSMSLDDDSKGRGIKYYTFYTNYSGYDKYSIESLELSRREKGRFVPASFEEVRNLAKKSRGRLTYFSSDENTGWKELLLEYGIVQTEWNNTMVALNQKEGGISSYFEQFKKSDKIVDELLIPTVEGRFLEVRPGDEDNSLETMLLTYARRYTQKKEFLEERTVSGKLSGSLQELKGNVEKLWGFRDQFETAKGLYFAFHIQLKEEQGKLESDILNLKEQLSEKSRQISRIRTEQASADYYLADEKLQKVQAELERTDEALKKTQFTLEKAEKLGRIMDCARSFGEIREKKSQLQAVQDSLRIQQEQSSGSVELKSLRYSVRLQLEALLPEKYAESAELSERIQDTEEGQRKLQTAAEKQKNAVMDADSGYHKQEGILDSAKKQTDALIKKLQIPVYRLLFGSYPQDVLTGEKKKKDDERHSAEQVKAKSEARMQQVKTELRDIPEQKTKYILEKKTAEDQKQEKEKELADYMAQETEIFAVCNRYSMDPSGCFSNVLTDYLKDQKLTADNSAHILGREIEIIRKQISAAEKGVLHIPEEIGDYLDQHGVEYQSGEKYLLAQVDEGHLTKEKCMEILQKTPALAYGILVTDRDKLFNDCRTGWLPAVLPVFSYRELQHILSGETGGERELALYSGKYFENHEMYLSELKKQEIDQISLLNSTLSRAEKIGEDLRIAESFNYSEDHMGKLEEEIGHLGDNITAVDQKITMLQNRMTELEKTEKQLECEIAGCDERIRLLNQWTDRYNELTEKIHQEETETVLEAELGRKAKEQRENLRKTEDSLQQTYIVLKELNERKAVLEEQLQKMQEASDAAAEADEAEICPGVWNELYDRYLSLVRMLGEKEKELLDQCDRLQKQIGSCQQRLDIERAGLLPEEYDTAEYSLTVKQSASETAKQKQKELVSLNDVKQKLSTDKGRAEADASNAMEALRRLDTALLPREEVGSDFEKRIRIVSEETVKLDNVLQAVNERKNKVDSEYNRTEDRLRSETRPEKIPGIVIQIDRVDRQNSELYIDFADKKELLKKEDSSMQKQLRKVSDEYKDSYTHIREFFRNLTQLAENDGAGDRYFSMVELLDGVIKSLNLRIHQITGDLEDFDKSKEDLIRQCLLQARKILTGLNGLQNHSRIQVYEGRQNIQMIRMPGLPKDVDEVSARVSIENEIDKGTEEIAARMQEDDVSENDLRKKANQIVGSRQLLRKYIMKDHIRLEAYKVDKNPENAQYRSWEETQTENSGAQKFLVYFSMIVAIVAYNRSEAGFGNAKEQTSVLILDNPFGPISSAYALKPMFALARKLNVQMICLSNITLCDITICFEHVIKAVLRKQPLSSVEMLTHDRNEQLEHGFYESEQLTFDFLQDP